MSQRDEMAPHSSRPSSVISTRQGRLPFMPTPRNRDASAERRPLKMMRSYDSIAAKARGMDTSMQQHRAELEALGIYENLENVPATKELGHRRSFIMTDVQTSWSPARDFAQEEAPRAVRAKPMTSSRPKRGASPLKTALNSAGMARVPVSPIKAAPFNLSPTKTASPRLSARAASSIKGKYSLEDLRAPSPTPVNARVTEGISTRSTQTRPAGSPLKQMRSTRSLKVQSTDGDNGPVRSAVEYEFDEEDAANSSFVYQPTAEESTSATSSSSDIAQQETVTVHVRIRPNKTGEECAWIPGAYPPTVSLVPELASLRTQRDAGAPHCFDGVHIGSSNAPLYSEIARPLVRAALDGYDAVVFAYGQTASGKTFTLSGDEAGREPGIIPRAIRDVFRGIQQSEDSREYLLRVSYLEVWNENIKDLLDPTNVPVVRDDRRRGAKGTIVQPLREEIVTSPAAVAQLLERGQQNRHVGATDWNERSSRSHTCFKMTIESWQRDMADGSASPVKGGKKVRISELSLIDLAGSEKYVSQGSDRRAEGAHINKSLLTLGKVILHLSERSTVSSSASASASAAHIPYRDSKLTRILQNSLSGNARVAVICTLNPSPNAVEESLSTLNFAHRVKKVTVHAKRREIQEAAGVAGSEVQALLLRYKLEAEALRQQVELMQSGDDRVAELQKRLDDLEKLKVRGGRRSTSGMLTSEDEDDDLVIPFIPARPVSPVKGGGGLDFTEPPHIVRERLFAAESRITELEAQLEARPALSASSDDAKLRRIGELEKQVRELELVCEAQAAAPLPKVKEDVEREWKARVENLEKQLKEKENYISMLDRQCAAMRKENKKLWKLAHVRTGEMLSDIRTPDSPITPRTGSTSRPASVMGTMSLTKKGSTSLLQQTFSSERIRSQSTTPSPSGPSTPTLGTKRAAPRRRSRSLGQSDTVAALDKLVAMAEGSGSSADEEEEGDTPKRRKQMGLRRGLTSHRFLDTSIRDIQAEIEQVAIDREISFATDLNQL